MKNIVICIILAAVCVVIHAQHFDPVFDPDMGAEEYMYFFVYTAEIEGDPLGAGDEIAIFDGNFCVGVTILEESIDINVRITTGKNDLDPPDQNGYIEDNTIIYKLWDGTREYSSELDQIRVEYLDTSYQDGVFADREIVLVHLFVDDTSPPAPGLDLPQNGAEGQSLLPTLQWSEVMAADYYEIQLSKDADFVEDVIIDTDTEDLFYDVTEPLEGDTEYFWRVRSVIEVQDNDDDAGDWSDVWSFTTIAAPELIAPENNATDIEINPLFQWETVTGALDYEIQVALDSDFDIIVRQEQNITVSDHQFFEEFDEGTEYFWRVRGDISDGDYSEWSDIWSFTTEEAIAVLFDSNEWDGEDPVVNKVNTNATPITNHFPDDEYSYLARGWTDDEKHYIIEFATISAENIYLTSSVRREHFFDFDIMQERRGPNFLQTQYRIGDEGDWISFGNTHPEDNPVTWDLGRDDEFINIAIDLPEECENREIVQFRWRSFPLYDVLNDGGIEIKDVIVTGEVEEEPYEPPPGDEMVYDEVENRWDFTFDDPVHGELTLFFVPRNRSRSPGNGIFISYSTDPNHPVIQDEFPNPPALGIYYRFIFEDKGLMDGTIGIQLPDEPIQIWSRRDETGDFKVITPADGPLVPDFTYTVDVEPNGGRNNDWGYIEFASDNGIETLPVELSSFTAAVTANMFVELNWTAETETNMLGYNIYRSQSDDLSDAVKVNYIIVPAYNSSEPKDYVYIDENVQPGRVYYYWLQANDLDLTYEFHGPISVFVEDQGEEGSIIGADPVTKLIGAYPNPFNPGTHISFSLAEESQVTITVFNSAGQKMQTIVEDALYDTGRHSVYWDGKDRRGSSAASGVYFYRMETEEESMIKKMMLLK